jgi:hypothetical protein
MFLAKKISQSRRDFKGVFKCQGCGESKERSGYDDDYFHIMVTFEMKCEKCGESTNSLKLTQPSIKTEYGEWEVV